MSTSNVSTRLRSEGLAVRLVAPAVLLISFLFLLAVIWPAPARAWVYDPFEMVVDIKAAGKPTQTFIEYVVKDGAAEYLVNGGKFAASSYIEDFNASTRDKAHDTAMALAAEEALNADATRFGYVGLVGTFAEHALRITPLGPFNDFMTDAGLFVTAMQVSMDLKQGKDRKAATDAYKGMMSFAFGKFVTGPMQLSTIAFFIIDQSLTNFGETAWAEREKAWRHVYQRYYAQKEAEYAGTVTNQRELMDRVAAIRARTGGGRSANDWLVLATAYYEHAKSPEIFEYMINRDIEQYAARFWTAPDFDEYSADGDWSTAGFARASSLTKDIRDHIEAEHANTIRAKLIRDVFPKLQIRKAHEALVAEAERMTKERLDLLNAKVSIEVSAYDIDAVTDFDIILPNSGSWSGKLAPGKSRELEITKLALFLAGFPDTIVLHRPDGDETKQFTLVEDEAVVVFGMPETDQILQLSREESALECTITVTEQDGYTETSTETRAAPPAISLHEGINAEGAIIFGRFSLEEGWQMASPGFIEGTELSFGAPYFEDIHSLSGIEMVRTDGDFFGLLGQQKYQVTRADHKRGEFGEVSKIICTSTMTLGIEGAFSAVEGKMTYVPIDRDQFEMIEDAYEQARELAKDIPGASGMFLPDGMMPGGGN